MKNILQEDKNQSVKFPWWAGHSASQSWEYSYHKHIWFPQQQNVYFKLGIVSLNYVKIRRAAVKWRQDVNPELPQFFCDTFWSLLRLIW